MRGFPLPRGRGTRGGSAAIPPLFFYGTLMDPELLRFAAGAEPARIEPALLPGWRRMKAAGRAYPVVTRAAACHTEGLLAHGLGAEALRRLIRYEGPEYRTARLAVRTAAGRRHLASVFVPLATPDRLRGGRRPWQLEEWRRRWRFSALRMASRTM